MGLLHCRQILYHLSHQGSSFPSKDMNKVRNELFKDLGQGLVDRGNKEPKGGSKMELTVATPRPKCRRERGRMVGREGEEAVGAR